MEFKLRKNVDCGFISKLFGVIWISAIFNNFCGQENAEIPQFSRSLKRGKVTKKRKLILKIAEIKKWYLMIVKIIKYHWVPYRIRILNIKLIMTAICALINKSLICILQKNRNNFYVRSLQTSVATLLKLISSF